MTRYNKNHDPIKINKYIYIKTGREGEEIVMRSTVNKAKGSH